MDHRRLEALVAIATVCLISLPAGAQTRAATREAPPRTPWGDPDLQGIWNNSTLTPFQRPEALGDQDFLTEEEAASLEQAAADRNSTLANRPALRTAADPTGNVDRGVDGAPGSYNNFWMERGTTVLATRRTSVIVDPPTGRFPPLTPETHDRMTSPEAKRIADVRSGRLRPIRGSSSTWVTVVSGIEGFRHFQRRITTTTRSCRTPTLSPFSRSTFTTSGSSRWTDVRTSQRSSANMEEIRVATGRATRSWSRRPVSATALLSEISMRTSPRTCMWSNASRVSARTRSTTSSR